MSESPPWKRRFAPSFAGRLPVRLTQCSRRSAFPRGTRSAIAETRTTCFVVRTRRVPAHRPSISATPSARGSSAKLLRLSRTPWLGGCARRCAPSSAVRSPRHRMRCSRPLALPRRMRRVILPRHMRVFARHVLSADLRTTLSSIVSTPPCAPRLGGPNHVRLTRWSRSTRSARGISSAIAVKPVHFSAKCVPPRAGTQLRGVDGPCGIAPALRFLSLPTGTLHSPRLVQRPVCSANLSMFSPTLGTLAHSLPAL